MTINLLSFTTALRALGKAVPFVGDWTITGGLVPLGATEGPIVEGGMAPTINGLTAPEHTGWVLHDVTITPGSPTITIPTIVGDPTIWQKINPWGGSGVPQNPIRPGFTGLFLVPITAFTSPGGISYNGSVWTPSGVDTNTDFLNSILFGKGFLTHGDVSHPFENGGKSITPVTFTPMFDVRLPVNKQIWVRGNPVTEGVTTFRL